MDTGESDDLRVLDRAEAELEDVERALRRLDEGTYGTCEACGRAIGDDRLEGSPLTRRCADHAPTETPAHPAGTPAHPAGTPAHPAGTPAQPAGT